MSTTAQDRTIRLLLLEGALLDASIAAWPPRVVGEFETTERLYVGDVVTIDGVKRIVRSGHLADDGSRVLLVF